MPLAVCATPIGNLEDVTLRVLRELAEADLVLCEDTRHTRGLLDRHGIEARLLSYHQHNEAQRTAELLPRLEAGERIALVSDAGLPGVNDPGARLIAAALEAGIPVTVLPGPSAVETALVASGLAGERYQFLGYLPRGEKARNALWAELAAWPHPAVAFESPQRLPATLRSLAAALPDRPVAVCRELTKRFEEVVRGSPAELAARFAEPPKGEITLVVGAGGGRGERADADERARRRRRARRGRRAAASGSRRGRATGASFPQHAVCRIVEKPLIHAASVVGSPSTSAKAVPSCGRSALPSSCSRLSSALVTPVAAGAHAWTWPAAGPVLRPFSLGADTYAAGQHRGVDIGAELGSAGARSGGRNGLVRRLDPAAAAARSRSRPPTATR